jgi:DNA-binding phage protein
MDAMTPSEQNSTRSAEVEHLRDSVAAHAGSTSLRRVAGEIGMSATGLKKFLQGTDPYFPTIRRLQTWYVQHAAVESGHLQLEDASAAINVLLHDLAPRARQGMAGQMIEALARGYGGTGKDTPVWLSDLRARHADEEADTTQAVTRTSAMGDSVQESPP